MQDVCVSDNGNVDNLFLDVVELSDRVDAESIYNSIMASLQKVGMNNEFLRTHLISVATDGAAVPWNNCQTQKRVSKCAICLLPSPHVGTRSQRCSQRGGWPLSF